MSMIDSGLLARLAFQLSPSQLSPLAWYDVHLAGAAGQTVADQMGGTAATLGSTAGVDANDPLWLPRVGTDYLYLPGTGSDTLTCTAPAGTANYRTTDSTGTQATSAASAGAFTFSTTGSWASVELLNGSSVVIASFSASLSSQTGYTDTFGVAWTINRSTGGRKAALIKNRGILLLGTDDYLALPQAAVPSMVQAASASVVVVFRMWPTPLVYGRFFSTEPADPGIGVTLVNEATNTRVFSFVNDGLGGLGDTAIAYPTGAVTVAATLVNARNASTGLQTRVNGTYTAGINTSTKVDLTTSSAMAVGRTAGSNADFLEFELMGILTFSRLLTSAELSSIESYYGAGT